MPKSIMRVAQLIRRPPANHKNRGGWYVKNHEDDLNIVWRSRALAELVAWETGHTHVQFNGRLKKLKAPSTPISGQPGSEAELVDHVAANPF